MYIAIAYSYTSGNDAMHPVTKNILSCISDKGYIICADGIYYSDINTVNCIFSWEKYVPRISLFRRAVSKFGYSSTKDLYTEWAKKAYHYAKVLCCNTAINTVISFSYPHSAHFTANYLAIEYNLKWISYIADPLVNGLTYEENTTRFKRAISKIETTIVKYAHTIIVNSMTYYRQLSVMHNNVHYLLHGYSEMYNKEINNKNKNAKPHVVHFGNIYGSRTIVPWSKAVNMLGEKEIVHVNYGYIKNDEVSCAEKSGIQCRKALTYSDFINETRVVLGLIVLCGTTRGARLSLPTKLIEYIGSMRPVFIFASKDSEAARIGTAMGYRLADPSKVTECNAEYQTFIEECQTKSDRYPLREMYSIDCTRIAMETIYDK